MHVKKRIKNINQIFKKKSYLFLFQIISEVRYLHLITINLNMDFSSGSSVGGKGLGANEKAAIMSNLKQQLDIANAQEMLQQINEKCFKMCISKPSSSLSSSDQVNSDLNRSYKAFLRLIYFFFLSN